MGNSFSDERNHENEIECEEKPEKREIERKKERKTPKRRVRKNKSIKNKIKYLDI